jgi:hypothetical protein
MKLKRFSKFEDVVRHNILNLLSEREIQQKELAYMLKKKPQQLNNALKKRTTIINLISEIADVLNIDEMILFQIL